MIRSLAHRWADTQLVRDNKRQKDRGDRLMFLALRLAGRLRASRHEVRRLTAELAAMKEKT